MEERRFLSDKSKRTGVQKPNSALRTRNFSQKEGADLRCPVLADCALASTLAAYPGDPERPAVIIALQGELKIHVLMIPRRRCDCWDLLCWHILMCEYSVLDAQDFGHVLILLWEGRGAASSAMEGCICLI